MRKYSLSIDICRTSNIKVEDVFAENDKILDKIINQVCMLNKIFSFRDRTQVGPKADCNVVRVHLGFFAKENIQNFQEKTLYYIIPVLGKIIEESEEVSCNSNMGFWPLLDNVASFHYKFHIFSNIYKM